MERTAGRTVDEIWRDVQPTVDEIASARARLHRKAMLIVGLLVTSYFLLVVADSHVVVRAGAAMVLVVALVALATGVMHDANHGSFARRRGANHALAYTSDALGASSWLWRIQHNVLHHGNTNVIGYDADLELAPFARLAPSQPWRRRYRYQHLYIWPLYGFLAMKNLLVSDVASLVSGRIGDRPLNRPVTGSVVTRIGAGKLSHLTWALAIPLLFNPWPAVLAVYVVCSWCVGFLLATVFQLAHCVEHVAMPDVDTPRRGPDRAGHQLDTTFDVASPPTLLGSGFRWLAGGLDHQVEHHLAPQLPHTIYPMVARRFRAACAAEGLEHRQHPGIGAALRSHTRWLRSMGRRPADLERSGFTAAL